MKSGTQVLFHFSCFVVAMVIVAVSTVSLNGCSTEARYKTLTFFFTGVPVPGSELTEADKSIQFRLDDSRSRKNRRRVFFQEPKFYLHGPFAAGECEKCHSRESARQFRIGGANTRKTSARAKKRFGPRLAYPLEKLCVTCHVEKSDPFARSLNLTMHEPVATGMCVKCHDPHKAVRPFMLKGKDTTDLCATACHAEDGFRKTEIHREEKGKDCLECHNPHVGKTAQLLRSDFDEWQQFDGNGK